METLKSIEQEWQTFARAIFKGVPASNVQRREMHRAFFAGAFVMLKNCQRLGEPDIAEADGVQWLEDRMQEAEDFYATMIREYAEGN